MINLILAVFLVGAATGCQAQKAGPVENLGPEAFAKQLESSDGILIDVRTPDEYSQGHIAGARLMNFHDPSFLENVAALDTAETVYLYCRSGNRSSQAIKIMQEAGITGIVHLEKGINSWKAAGLPLEQ